MLFSSKADDTLLIYSRLIFLFKDIERFNSLLLNKFSYWNIPILLLSPIIELKIYGNSILKFSSWELFSDFFHKNSTFSNLFIELLIIKWILPKTTNF